MMNDDKRGEGGVKTAKNLMTSYVNNNGRVFLGVTCAVAEV